VKGNRKIIVEVEGNITDEMRKEYHHILADVIVAQYGIEVAKQILEGLKKEEIQS
jgi:pentose-5-phosphate-3-epimerase